MELLIGNYRIAILGAGNIGLSIAKGLLHSGLFEPGKICLTRRRIHLLSSVEKSGIIITRDNTEAVRNCDIIIIAVEPQQIKDC
jgi:pyrroline-5-carboxylate reductase